MEQLMNGFSFEGHVYSEELDILKTLKPHVIITTNYDTLMEKIFPEYNVIIGQQVIKRRETTNIGHILKIHGCMTKPEEIIISKEDYDGFEERQKYLIAKLLTYFMEHPVVFLGYSLNDPNIKAILTDIAAILNGDSDEVVNNIWFIEWKEKIDSNFKPPTDKTIDLGNGKSIRVNYIQVNRFNEIFKSLYQHTAITMDILRELQSNIYNIIKSKTITNLEVDMVRLQTIKDEEELARLIGLTSICSAKSLTNEPLKVIGIGTIADPEQIIARYPMRISQLAEKLGLSSWYHVDVMIKKIYRETGFNIKGSNNRYHIDIGITQPEHRYSAEALMLFRKILNEEPYSVYDENDNELYPEFEQLAF
jgi:SIR2-like domain